MLEGCANVGKAKCGLGLGCQQVKKSLLSFRLGGFKKALSESVEAPKLHSGQVPGRFGLDFWGLPGCKSDCWSVTQTFGL